eukprot:gene34489-56470_t
MIDDDQTSVVLPFVPPIPAAALAPLPTLSLPQGAAELRDALRAAVGVESLSRLVFRRCGLDQQAVDDLVHGLAGQFRLGAGGSWAEGAPELRALDLRANPACLPSGAAAAARLLPAPYGARGRSPAALFSRLVEVGLPFPTASQCRSGCCAPAASGAPALPADDVAHHGEGVPDGPPPPPRVCGVWVSRGESCCPALRCLRVCLGDDAPSARALGLRIPPRLERAGGLRELCVSELRGEWASWAPRVAAAVRRGGGITEALHSHPNCMESEAVAGTSPSFIADIVSFVADAPPRHGGRQRG